MHHWPFGRSMPPGTHAFADISPAVALVNLRRLLGIIGVADAQRYRTHDLRRGHTMDLAESGSSLVDLLKAGQWSAVKAYLDMQHVEDMAVQETQGISSSDDGDVPSDVSD